ncbi:Patched domain-containing protein 3 [Sarcoptes scabiei]|uniref:Uncharacterized protein n=1 Tax=Sarcoptes scabiei TaxID=52283 RepID=A0A132AI08_SARSC|nr:hypothetical protein QR98_0086280 [Sarcoptes scabiei]UXI23060.1 Patched domain-containing protein 3 [Sarcoptes scabiei]
MSNKYNESFDLINMMYGHAAGHYYNDAAKNVADYADGWYIRRAKQNRGDLREMLIDLNMRKKRLEDIYDFETGSYRPLDNGFVHAPEVQRVPHLDYRHRKGRFEHLYRKQF